MPVITPFPWKQFPSLSPFDEAGKYRKTKPQLYVRASAEGLGYHLGTRKYHGVPTTLGKVLADLESQLESQEKYGIPPSSKDEKRSAEDLKNLKIKIEAFRLVQFLINNSSRFTSTGPTGIPGYEDITGLKPPIAEPPVSPLHLLDR